MYVNVSVNFLFLFLFLTKISALKVKEGSLYSPKDNLNGIPMSMKKDYRLYHSTNLVKILFKNN